MTPEDKALEIWKKNYNIIQETYNDKNVELAKQLSLFFVEEIMWITTMKASEKECFHHIEYWQEVKQYLIKKL